MSRRLSEDQGCPLKQPQGPGSPATSGLPAVVKLGSARPPRGLNILGGGLWCFLSCHCHFLACPVGLSSKNSSENYRIERCQDKKRKRSWSSLPFHLGQELDATSTPAGLTRKITSLRSPPVQFWEGEPLKTWIKWRLKRSAPTNVQRFKYHAFSLSGHSVGLGVKGQHARI